MKRIDAKTVHVTELPVGVWSDKFKEQCYSLIERGIMSKLVNESTTEHVNFLLKDLKDTTMVKLTSTLHLTNMVLFNHNNIITKYETIDCILQEFLKTRLYFYKLRKEYQVNLLTHKIDLNKNKIQFILKIIGDNNFLKQDELTIINILNNERFLKVKGTFNYLLNISIRECTINSLQILKTTTDSLIQELDDLKKLSEKQIWLKELTEVKLCLL
jgi:DNA topoisomerase-2